MNGKEYDHPVTDVAIHGMRVFSLAIDTLIAQIAALDGYQRLYADPELDPLLDLPINEYGKGNPGPPGLEAGLRHLRDELAELARGSGQHPDEALLRAAAEVRERWSRADR